MKKYHWKRQLTKHTLRIGFRHNPNKELSKITDWRRLSKPLAISTYVHHSTLAIQAVGETEVTSPSSFVLFIKAENMKIPQQNPQNLQLRILEVTLHPPTATDDENTQL